MESMDPEKLGEILPEAAGRSSELVEDWAYIISSLSSLFFSTYYLNLEQDTFRAVTQLRRVGDLLGNEVNCTAAQIGRAHV